MLFIPKLLLQISVFTVVFTSDNNYTGRCTNTGILLVLTTQEIHITPWSVSSDTSSIYNILVIVIFPETTDLQMYLRLTSWLFFSNSERKFCIAELMLKIPSEVLNVFWDNSCWRGTDLSYIWNVRLNGLIMNVGCFKKVKWCLWFSLCILTRIWRLVCMED